MDIKRIVLPCTLMVLSFACSQADENQADENQEAPDQQDQRESLPASDAQLEGINTLIADTENVETFKLYANRRGLEIKLPGTELLARVWPESWRGDELTRFVIRYHSVDDAIASGVYGFVYDSQSDELVALDQEGSSLVLDVQEQNELAGRFVTGITGRLEKFKEAGEEQEKLRLVFRRNDGTFITWAKIPYVEGWNRTASGWHYEVRFAAGARIGDRPVGGLWINKASLPAQLWLDAKASPKIANKKAALCFTGRQCPTIALRDTADGTNNGKFLTLLTGRQDTASRCQYRNNKPLSDGSQGKLITMLYPTHIEQLCGEK